MKERPTNVPTVMCTRCGEWIEVVPDGRGFPPNIAKRKLAKMCGARGHKSEPSYRAGVTLTQPGGMSG